MSILDKEKYQKVYKKAEVIKNALGIKAEVQLKEMYSDILNGEFSLRGSVRLSKPLLRLLGTKYEKTIYFILAHELVHLKYKDSGLKLLTWNVMGLFKVNKGNALIVLMEMRATIEANAILGLSNQEIDDIQMYMQERNKSKIGKTSYKLGYPDRYKIADFSKRYKFFDEIVMKELLDDFCEVMNVKNKEEFTNKVINTFKSKCYPKM